MTAVREWPIHRAQAKCARIAADFLIDGYLDEEANVLLKAAECGSAPYNDGTCPAVHYLLTEASFRELLAGVLSWGPEEIEPAVAWVYGETATATHRSHEKRATPELLSTVEQLTAERDDARAWVRRLTSSERVLTCVYCGEAYPPGTPNHGADALTAHVRTCLKHPLRAAEAEVERLRGIVEEALGHVRDVDDAMALRTRIGAP